MKYSEAIKNNRTTRVKKKIFACRGSRTNDALRSSESDPGAGDDITVGSACLCGCNIFAFHTWEDTDPAEH